MQEQTSPYASRNSITRLRGVGGTKNKRKKKVRFAIDSSDRDQTWAPSVTSPGTRQRSTQEQPSETEIKAAPADGQSSKQDALASGSKLFKSKGGAVDIPTTPEQGAGKGFAAEDNQANSTAASKTHNQRADI
jgi:hypothetical protein